MVQWEVKEVYGIRNPGVVRWDSGFVDFLPESSYLILLLKARYKAV